MSVNVNKPLSRLPSNRVVILLKAKVATIRVLLQPIRTLGHHRAASRFKGPGTALRITARLITTNRRRTTITLPHSRTRVTAIKVVTARTRISRRVTTDNHKLLSRTDGTRLQRLGLLSIVELIGRLFGLFMLRTNVLQAFEVRQLGNVLRVG